MEFLLDAQGIENAVSFIRVSNYVGFCEIIRNLIPMYQRINTETLKTKTMDDFSKEEIKILLEMFNNMSIIVNRQLNNPEVSHDDKVFLSQGNVLYNAVGIKLYKHYQMRP